MCHAVISLPIVRILELLLSLSSVHFMKVKEDLGSNSNEPRLADGETDVQSHIKPETSYLLQKLLLMEQRWPEKWTL